jgi:hypothetical protein
MIRILLGIILLFAAVGGVDAIHDVASFLCVLSTTVVGVFLFLSGIEK